MYYSKDENQRLFWAGLMERRRMLFYDRNYAKMHAKYWCLDKGRPMTAEEKKELLELKGRLERELIEYTASEAFDPKEARKLRAQYRKSLKEALKKGNWLSR